MLQKIFRSSRLFILTLPIIFGCSFLVYSQPTSYIDWLFNSAAQNLTKADDLSSQTTALRVESFYQQNYLQSRVDDNSIIDFKNNLKQTDSLTNLTALNKDFKSLILADGKESFIENADSVLACAPIPINLGQTISDATLSTTDCFLSGKYYDDYTFSGTAGQKITVTMSATSPLIPLLMFYNSNGQALPTSSDNTRIYYTLPANGVYTIRATSYDPNQTGTYSITLANSGICNLTTTPINAGQVISGLSLTATDCLNTDGTYYDDYTLTGSAGQKLAVSMRSTAFRTSVRLYNSNNQILYAAYDSGRSFDSVMIFTLPADGFYTIRATSNFFSTQNSGAYTVALNENTNLTISGKVRRNTTGIGLSGVTVTLESVGTHTSVTDSNGNYSFTNLPANGDYFVTPTLAGNTITPRYEYIGNLTAIRVADFTAVEGVSVSGGLVTIAPAPAPGNNPVSINCTNGFSSSTTVSSSFAFIVPVNSGSCTITPGGSFGWSPVNRTVTVGTQDIPNLIFTIVTPVFNVIGTINNLANAPGTTVSVNGINCPISGSTYTCSNLIIFGSYGVVPSHPTAIFSPTSNYYPNITSGYSSQNFTAVATQTISGQVTRSGAGLSGVTVALSGSGTGTRTTDASGNYSFTGLTTGGNYTVTPTLAGHTFAPSNRTFNNLTDNPNNSNFTALQDVTISGRLKNANGNNLPASVQVTLNIDCANGFSSNLAVSGAYTVAVPQNSGNCTISPSTSSGTNGGVGFWNPSSASVTVGTQNITGIDFMPSTPTYSIIGTLNGMPNTSGLSVTLSLNGTGTIVPCTIDQTTFNYTCFPLVIYGDYTITPSHPNFTFSPAPRQYLSITNGASAQNYTASPVPGLSIGSNSILEGNGGTTPLNFTVNLSAASSQAVTVNYSTANGTATAGQDYTAVTNGTVTIPAGSLSGTAVVQIIGDTIVEPNETFTVTLSSPQGAAITQGTATGTITNDDSGGSLQFAAAAYSVTENGGTAAVTVTRTGGTASGVTINYATSAGGTATAGQDYITTSGTLTFNAGDTSKSFTIPIINDSINEPNETVNLTLSNATGGGTLGTPATAVLTINDDDGAPTLSINDVSQNEGNSGTTAFNFTVSLSGATSQTVTVNFAAASDSATSPSDFQAASGTLSFAPGDTSKSITVLVNGDTLVEPNETFKVNLSNAAVATILNGQGIGTIINDDQSIRRTQFDFDNDGKADVSVFRPSNGYWYLMQSQAGFTGVPFGIATDKLVPADYDGDGRADVAVVRNGIWYLLRSQAGFTGIQFGDGNDVPVPGDYDGDGKAELAVFRPSNGYWYLLNLTTNQFTATPFGISTDKPVPADYDGDGKTDIAVNRSGIWYLLRSQAGFTGIQFGDGNDKLVPADYDGDGKADIAVFRPSNGTWYLLQTQAGFTGLAFGLGTDLPVPADYDGDGKADVAVFRPSNGYWYLQRSGQGFTGIPFGVNTDKPLPNAFVP